MFMPIRVKHIINMLGTSHAPSIGMTLSGILRKLMDVLQDLRGTKGSGNSPFQTEAAKNLISLEFVAV